VQNAQSLRHYSTDAQCTFMTATSVICRKLQCWCLPTWLHMPAMSPRHYCDCHHNDRQSNTQERSLQKTNESGSRNRTGCKQLPKVHSYDKSGTNGYVNFFVLT